MLVAHKQRKSLKGIKVYYKIKAKYLKSYSADFILLLHFIFILKFIYCFCSEIQKDNRKAWKELCSNIDANAHLTEHSIAKEKPKVI